MRVRKLAGTLMIIGLVSCSSSKKESTCLEMTACFNENTNTYDIEENASVTVAGLPVRYGERLIELWNEQYPELAGMLVMDATYDQNTAISTQYAAYDIIFTYEELSGAYQSQLYPLDTHLLEEIYPASYLPEKTWKDLFGKNTTNTTTDAAAQTASSELAHTNVLEELVVDAIQPYYMPIAYEGVSFFYNKTMLEAIGVDMTSDANNDDMPDVIESWESIFALADSWATKRPIYRKKPVNIVFPFSLNESSLSYFMFTSNGFRLFPTHDGMNPGYQSEEFLRALEFITEASKHPMAQSDKGVPYRANDYKWQWEKVYTHQIAPLGLVAPWMDLAGAAKANKVEYIVSPYFPTYQGTQMKPFVTTMGYVLRSNTKVPSAAHHVLKFLRSDRALQAMIDTSDLVPYYISGQTLSFENDPNRKNMQKSLSTGDSMPLIAMPNNIYKNALDGYYEINHMEVIRRLWDGLIDPAQARSEISFLYQQWFFDNTKIKIPASKPTN